MPRLQLPFMEGDSIIMERTGRTEEEGVRMVELGVVNALFGGFVSKVINDCVDITKDKIKEADTNRKSKYKSPETRIYEVTIDVLNQLTFSEYKNHDILYDVAEKILSGLKTNNEDAVKSGLKCFSNLGNDAYERFKGLLYDEITNDNGLYKKISMIQTDNINNNINKIISKVDENGNKLDENSSKLDKANEGIGEIKKYIIQPTVPEKKHYPTVYSRTTDYNNIWNSNMFLNNYDKRDENAGINVKLNEVYLESHLPHYIWKNSINPRDDLKELLAEYIVGRKRENPMLLVLGQPGVGKSTLITWITANFTNELDNMLVYQFASDLKYVEFGNKDADYVVNELLKTIDFTYNDLNGKTLILDGFDELSVGSDRIQILNNLYRKLIRDSRLNNFSLIVTCRENYIQHMYNIGCDYIILQPYDDEQIRSFCRVYGEKIKRNISEDMILNILDKKEILGVPLILYMVLALDIAIDKDGSIAAVYDQIFSLEDGGIYDRCIENSEYAGMHEIVHAIKNQIHSISERIAMWMFEHQPDKAFIPQKEYTEICKQVMEEMPCENKNIESDFLIGNYFRLVKHCEGTETEELYFIHRSIYEYFVAEYICVSMVNAINSSSDIQEKLAGVFGKLLKGNRLSPDIIKSIKFKIINSELKSKFDIVSETFNLMLRDGMTSYTEECYKNVIECERKVFTNMLEIVHLWNHKHLAFDIGIYTYIKINKEKLLNLRGVDLIEDYLIHDDLREIDFELRRADLREADLRCVKLRGVDLTGVDLTGADLTEANLSGVNLTGVNLTGVNLSRADLTGADLSGAILINTMFCNKSNYTF